MKKTLSFLLAIGLCASLSACDTSEKSAISDVNTQTIFNGIYNDTSNDTPNAGGLMD